MVTRWSCLLDAFSIVTEIPTHRLIEMIGHDGSQILWPQQQEPLCRRGFHIQELTVACFRLGFAVVQFDNFPTIQPTPSENPFRIPTPGYDDIYESTNGVFTGFVDSLRHAVAWKHQELIDPAGKPIDFKKLRIEDYWCVLPIQAG